MYLVIGQSSLSINNSGTERKKILKNTSRLIVANKQPTSTLTLF